MTWLVVGLGNPGPIYARTRHNIGFMTADVLARRSGVSFKNERGMKAEVAHTLLGSHKTIVAKPRTFMNESGQAVSKIAAFYKIDHSRIIIVHDELDLDLGRLRTKCGGGDNGHNGLKSIRAHLGTGDFFRVRLGIGRPPGQQSGADYVLSSFPKVMVEEVRAIVEVAADAVETLITQGLVETQNRFNG